MRSLLSSILCLVVINCRAQSDNFSIAQIFPIEKSHSYVGFSVKYMGYAMVRGRFADFEGAVRYVEKEPNKTSVSISIDVNSIDSDNDWRDKDLKSPNWFNADQYPRIVFESTRTDVTPAGLAVTGNLTIHGVTKSVTIAMAPASGVLNDVRGDAQIIFTGGLSLSRNDYGVEGKNWSAIKEGITAVDDVVVIELSILAKQIKEKNFRNWVSNPESPAGKLYSIASQRGAANAIKEFESLRLNPESKVDEWALQNAGLMLLKEGKPSEALLLFHKNAEAFPQLAMVHEACGEAYAAMGNWKEARMNYATALEKKPGSASIGEVLRHIP